MVSLALFVLLPWRLVTQCSRASNCLSESPLNRSKSCVYPTMRLAKNRLHISVSEYFSLRLAVLQLCSSCVGLRENLLLVHILLSRGHHQYTVLKLIHYRTGDAKKGANLFKVCA